MTQKAKTPRALNLRARPPIIRYAYIAIGTNSIHAGLSYSGLAHAMAHDDIGSVIVVDIEKGINYPTDPKRFMEWWRPNYLNREADYERER